MTASWLAQMGMEHVAVLDDALDGAALARGAHQPEIPGLPDGVETIAPKMLMVAQQRGKLSVIDLATSLNYRAGHIPGAWFVIRSRLAANLPKIPRKEQIVLTSEDGTLARLAAPEVAQLLGTSVKVVEGGTAGWKRAGFPLAIGLENMADELEDVFWRPYDRERGQESAMKDYLGWEQGLMEQIQRDGDAKFRTLAR
jgi:rhodanese-related sulfurtransferase